MMGAREERLRNDERLVDAFVEEAQRGVGFISRVQLDEGWERLRAASEPEPRRVAAGRPGARAWLLGFAAAGAVALAALLLHRPSEAPSSVVRFTLEGDATTAENVVATSPGRTARLRFSDASRIELSAATRLEVAALDARGAQVVLLDGALEVDVKPRADTSWRFTAGPFRVDVKGTAFHLAFDARAATLRLRMTAGQVEVLAPPDRRLAVRAGESLELNDRAAEPGAPAPAAPPALPAADAEPSLEPALAPGPGRTLTRPPARRAATRVGASAEEPGPAPSWPALLARGSFATVVAEAERRGLDGVLAQAPAADLAALADSARYTRRPDLAQKALLAIRARFAGTEPAKDAAFFLGRLAEASSAQPDAALAWYDRYLREAPRGLYASDTLGREMTLLARGAPARARQVARAYLERFPEGPQAELARSLLEAE